MYALNYRQGPMWEPGYVTEVMGPRRDKVKLLNEDQLWHRYQNQLRYRHVEDDDTQSAEITDSTRTSPITGDSPLSFHIMRSQQKMLKQLPQIPFCQQVKVQEEHVITHCGIVDL